MSSKIRIKIDDFERLQTLGTGKFHKRRSCFTNIVIGSFGRVRLCKRKSDGKFFALKMLKKADIIKLKQVDHVISEMNILADINCPFLVSKSSRIIVLTMFLGWNGWFRSRLEILVLPFEIHPWR